MTCPGRLAEPRFCGPVSPFRNTPVRLRKAHLNKLPISASQLQNTIHHRATMKTSLSHLWMICLTVTTASMLAGNWPGWRGPEGNGVSADKNLPLKWSDKENVRWRVELPGPGNSSPIVWGDRVFVAQFV